MDIPYLLWSFHIIIKKSEKCCCKRNLKIEIAILSIWNFHTTGNDMDIPYGYMFVPFIWNVTPCSAEYDYCFRLRHVLSLFFNILRKLKRTCVLWNGFDIGMCDQRLQVRGLIGDVIFLFYCGTFLFLAWIVYFLKR